MNIGLIIACLMNPLPQVKIKKKKNNNTLLTSKQNEHKAKSAYQWAKKG